VLNTLPLEQFLASLRAKPGSSRHAGSGGGHKKVHSASVQG
jgi:hypothetical protein